MNKQIQNEVLEAVTFKEVISYATASLFTKVVEIEKSLENLVMVMNIFTADTQDFLFWCEDQGIDPEVVTMEQGIELLQRYEAVLIEEIKKDSEAVPEDSPLPPNLYRVMEGLVCLDCVEVSLGSTEEDSRPELALAH